MLSFSIITPSFNQADFIEQTIDSVRRQDYPHVEHIVVDGMSTDNTPDILNRHKNRMTIIREPDDGQTDAINKGFLKSNGDILAWLNADDLYLPGSLSKVADHFSSHPEVDFLYGDIRMIDERGGVLCARKEISFDKNVLVFGNNLFAQPATFFRRRLVEKIGLLDKELHFSMDYEFWLRALNQGARFDHIPEFLAAFRLQHSSKSVAQHARQMAEHRRILREQVSWAGFPLVPGCMRFFFRAKKVIKKLIQRRQFDLGLVTYYMRKARSNR